MVLVVIGRAADRFDLTKHHHRARQIIFIYLFFIHNTNNNAITRVCLDPQGEAGGHREAAPRAGGAAEGDGGGMVLRLYACLYDGGSDWVDGGIGVGV